MSKAIIIKRDYIAYLKTLPPETIVGNRAQQESCPISREVERLHPSLTDVYTEYDSIAFIDARGDEHTRQCTPWIEDFIHAVDDRDCISISRDLIQGAAKRVVTAAEALACLGVRS